VGEQLLDFPPPSINQRAPSKAHYSRSWQHVKHAGPFMATPSRCHSGRRRGGAKPAGSQPKHQLPYLTNFSLQPSAILCFALRTLTRGQWHPNRPLINIMSYILLLFHLCGEGLLLRLTCLTPNLKLLRPEMSSLCLYELKSDMRG